MALTHIVLKRCVSGAVAAAVLSVLALSTTTASAFPIGAAGTEGRSVIVTGTGNVMATFEGQSAAFSDDLLLNGNLIFNNHDTLVGTVANLGSFAVGTELVFELLVHNTGYSYYTGGAERNFDGHTHARVDDDSVAGKTLISFEDLDYGPYDYNDLSFTFTNVAGVAAAVPEPSTYAMMLAGFGVLSAAVRRSRKQRG